MTRKEFIRQMGVGSGLLVLASCLGGCDKDSPSSNPDSVDFTLDLTDPANVALTANGGYLIHLGVIVARTLTGAFIAVSKTCTHGGASVDFDANVNGFVCLRHGATFTSHGTWTGGPQADNLTEYATVLSGNLLRVHS